MASALFLCTRSVVSDRQDVKLQFIIVISRVALKGGEDHPMSWFDGLPRKPSQPMRVPGSWVAHSEVLDLLPLGVRARENILVGLSVQES